MQGLPAQGVGCVMSRSGGKDRPLGIAPAVPPVPPSCWAPVEPAAWVFFRCSLITGVLGPDRQERGTGLEGRTQAPGFHTCRKAGQPPPTLRQQSGRAFLNQRRLLLHIPTPTVTVCVTPAAHTLTPRHSPLAQPPRHPSSPSPK